MARKVRTWVLGCGVGCGAIIALGVVLLVAGGLSLTEGLKDSVQAGESLEERFGAEGSFTPSPDGSIPADRIDVFLEVRDALAPSRESLTRSFAGLPASEEELKRFDQLPLMERLKTTMVFGKAAFGLTSSAGEFFSVRNRVLLEKGMGMGEYDYIYVLAYYSWLGKDPSDGPPLGRTEKTASRLHKATLQMLRNALAALPAEDTEWRRSLAAEISAMESEPGRLPWRDGVPASTAASLAPYRERLVSAYSPATNPFELARNTKVNRWTYHID